MVKKVKSVDALVHKKSSVKDKIPTASQLELGELAVNFNHESPMVTFKADNDSIVKISPVAASDSPTAITVDNQNQQILLDVKKPDDTTIQLSGDATNIIFESDLKNGLEVNNHEVNIKIDSASTSGLTVSQDGIKLLPDSAISSSSTNVVENKVIKEELDKKLDKINFLNQIYPKGSIYITETNTNPSTFIGGTWELIGGEDADKNYYPAFAISTDTAGTTIDESLPNIKADADASYWYIGSTSAKGAFSTYATGTAHWGDSSGNYPYGLKFDASKGQTNADGTTYVPQTASTYQNGAQVNVNAIKLFFWRRTDDAPIAMMLKPVTLERTKDVLWSGNTGNGTISLSGSMADYDAIEFTFNATGFTVVQTVEIDKVVQQLIIPISWDANVNRYGFLTNITNTSFYLNVGTQTALRQVRGIKYGYVSRTDITAEINSESTNDKAAGAKAVYDALAGIQFIDRSKTISWGGSTASFTVDITCGADEVPLGKGATNVQTEGAVGYAYVSTLTKLSDTSYRFTGWANGNGANTLVVNATFVKMR